MEPVNFATLLGALPAGDRPLATRLYEAVRREILAGRVAEGMALPSTREAARQLGVARNTVIAAYELLASEGMVALAPRIAPVVLPHAAKPKRASPAPLRLSNRGEAMAQSRQFGKGVLRPGQPDPALFPADLWARALRRAGRRNFGKNALYESYQGLPVLREALADQLLRHQGLAVAAEQVLITPTTQASLGLIAQCLGDVGDVALVEDPGYGGARHAFQGAGLAVQAMPVGPEGALFDCAPAARLAYVTPAAQFPYGMTMSLPARHAALAWAKRHGSVLIADEYDGEFLWHGIRLPSLAAMAEGVGVITLGSAAKALLPGLRIGWMVVPEGLAGPLVNAQRNQGLAANIHAQAALAELLTEGALRVHLRRAARIYAERRDMVLSALGQALGESRAPHAPAGGLQMVLPLENAAQETACAEAAWAAGYGPRKLSWDGLTAKRFGLVIGFADATERRAAQFAAIIAHRLGQIF